MTDLSTLLVVACAVYLFERHLAVTAANRQAGRVETPEPVPPEILMIANDYPEEWAKEQFLSRARELYAEMGNWTFVLMSLKGEV